MTKRILPLFALITLAACLLSYKLGSAPAALAKATPSSQETTDQVAPAVPAPPAEWVVTNNAISANAAATKAGVAGVQHVADCISVTANTTGTSTGMGDEVVLLDGSTVLMDWWLDVPPAQSVTSAQISVCGLSVVGSVGNSMTLEFKFHGSGSEETVNLIGHDAT